MLGALLLLSLFVPGRERAASGDSSEIEGLRRWINCADCHAEIHREWLDSAHARAWTGSRFAAMMAESPDAEARCASCHAPRILLLAGPGVQPEARDLERAHGVDCIACHADLNFSMHGPHGARAPHKTLKDDRYSSVEVCASCHGQGSYFNQVDDWKSSQYAEAGITCQTCHMPAVERVSVQHWSIQGLPARRARRHTFRGSRDAEFLKSAASLELEVEDGRARLSVTNSATGHSLPGGGMRAVVALLVARDEDGKVLLSRRQSFDLDLNNNRLKPGETRLLEYTLPAGAAAVQAKLIYKLFHELPDENGTIMAEKELKF